MNPITAGRIVKAVGKTLLKRMIGMADVTYTLVEFNATVKGAPGPEVHFRLPNLPVGGPQAIKDMLKRVVKDRSPNKDKGEWSVTAKVNGEVIAALDGLSKQEYRKLEDKVGDGFRAFRT